LQARQHGGVTLADVLGQSLAPLVDFVYPPRCPLCGEAIAAQTGLCAACWSELVIPGEPACARCQRPFGDGPQPGAICVPCLAVPPKHDGIAAGTLYNDASRKLVLAFKHGKRIALAPMLARLVAARLPPLDGEWLVVPVPLHRWRLWRRGFNQAALLAGEVARLTGGTLLVDGLARRKPTPVLGGLTRKARAKAIKGAIAVPPGRKPRVKGAKVLLVDDVLTSGATSDACVAALKRAGAEKVVIACFARVLNEAL
jgi:ComF family protein